MLAQLGHLMSVTTLANVRLGIIPLAVLERPMWTVESFNVFDDATVHVELLSAQVTVTVPREIIVYLRAFDHLARLAVHGAEARSLISRAISDLS
ncbi:MAG: family transcriptional regulator [Actinomycetia bacterium]|nr:family transcriptional regulator [Actinomycetes bacterium]